MTWDPGALHGKSKIRLLARLVRIEHTLFSLPYAYLGAALSCPQCLTYINALLLALAVLGLRTASMAYNNIADLDIDKENPRTKNRPLVTGALRVRDAWTLVVLGSLLYYASALLLNNIAFMLSPLLWIIAMSYPYHKRVSPLPHFHLGLTLGLVVFGGAVGVCGDCHAASVEWCLYKVPWIYVLGVTLWVAGFDVYYSIMDRGFDEEHGVKSIPVLLGEERSITLGGLLHLLAGGLFAYAIIVYRLKWISIIATIISAALLLYQHILARKGFIPRAFNLNLLLGVLLPTLVTLDALLHGLGGK